MTKTLIFGHQNPDTDTITAAIAYANLKNALGIDAEAVRLGPVNKETQYALDYFDIKAQRQIEMIPENSDVILVDHNEFQQSAVNINEAHIVEVIDHHRIANFQTNEPLYMRVEPVGCTATILKAVYEENNTAISKEIAGLLVSAIISDTLLLKSPTCTQKDVDAAHELAEIAGVDLEKYGFDMLQAGADLSDKTVAELISMDAKEFDMNGSKAVVAQVNAVDTNAILQYQKDLESEINNTINEKNLDLFLFVVTDIVNNDSDVLCLGKAQKNAEAAFHVTLNQNRAHLKDVVSRKKQIVPKLQETF